MRSWRAKKTVTIILIDMYLKTKRNLDYFKSL